MKARKSEKDMENDANEAYSGVFFHHQEIEALWGAPVFPNPILLPHIVLVKNPEDFHPDILGLAVFAKAVGYFYNEDREYLRIRLMSANPEIQYIIKSTSGIYDLLLSEREAGKKDVSQEYKECRIPCELLLHGVYGLYENGTLFADQTEYFKTAKNTVRTKQKKRAFF